MREQKQRALLEGETAIARKIFDAVPMGDPWSITEIISELGRRRIGVADKRTVQGVLESLVNKRLIRQPSPGMFVQSKTGGSIANVDTTEYADLAPNTPEPDHKEYESVLDHLASIADRLASLSKELEVVALDVQEQMGDADEKAAKFQQLQTLLKDI